MANPNRYLALLVCAAACDTSGTVPSDASTNQPDAAPAVMAAAQAYSDGTRIVQRYQILTTSDGYAAKTPAGMFDKKLNTPCSPRLADDGVTRCLPLSTAQDTGYFSDSSCLQPLVSVPKCDPVPEAALWPFKQAMGCFPAQYGVYATGPKITVLFELGSGASCIPLSYPVPKNYDFYLRGNKVDTLSFAEIRVEVR